VQLKGWVRTSLIDYPDHIATVLFTGGCNFRCPPCHNADLVLRPNDLPDLPLDEVWGFLARRVGMVDGIVISGGEPTIQPELLTFVGDVRELGLDVKLDTNGYRPDVLEALLEAGMLDYVALDVKAPPDKYPLLTGRPDLDLGRLERSIGLLQASGLKHEFRTTVVPEWLDEGDIESIARWISGAELYVLQQFRPLHTLDPTLKMDPYPVDRLWAMARRAQRWVGEVQVRGG